MNIPVSIYFSSVLGCKFKKLAGFMIIKNKARVNAFYFIYLPPRFLSRKTHGVSLYANLIIYFDMAMKYAEKLNEITPTRLTRQDSPSCRGIRRNERVIS